LASRQSHIRIAAGSNLNQFKSLKTWRFIVKEENRLKVCEKDKLRITDPRKRN